MGRIAIRRLAVWAALVTVAVLATAGRAQASLKLIITAGTGNSAVTQTFDSNSSYYSYNASAGLATITLSNYTIGGFSITSLTATSNAPGSADGSFISSIDQTTRNLGSNSSRITFEVLDTAFNIPGANAYGTVKSSFTSSFLSNGASASFTGTLSQAGGSDIVQSYNAVNLTGLSQVFQRTPAPTFKLDALTTLNLGANKTAQTNGSMTVLPTPEPTTMMAALAGVPVLLIGARLRRRSAVVA